MRYLLMLFFILIFNTSWGQCDGAWSSKSKPSRLLTKASHWKVGNDFDCKIFFEHTSKGLRLYVRIIENNEPFRMEKSDQMVFKLASGKSLVLDFIEDAERVKDAQDRSVYINRLRLEKSQLQTLTEQEVDFVFFSDMLAMRNQSYRLRGTNKKLFKGLAQCMLQEIDASYQMLGDAPAKVVPKAAPKQEEKPQNNPPNNDNSTASNTEEEATTTDEQATNANNYDIDGEIWSLADLKLPADRVAKRYAKQLEVNLASISDAALKQIILNIKLGRLFFEQKRYSAAVPYFDKALRLIETANKGDAYQPRAEALMASIYVNKEQYALAAIFNTNALSVWKNKVAEEDKPLVYEAYLNQALILKNLRPSEANNSYYEKVVPTSQKDWQKQLASLGKPPIKHQDSEKSTDYNLALLLYQNAEKSIEDLTTDKQPKKRIEVAIEMGQLYFDANHYQEAEPYFQKALQLVNRYQPNDEYLLAKVNRKLGETNQRTASYEEASQHLQVAKQQSIGANTPINESLVEKVDEWTQAEEVVHYIANQGSLAYQKDSEDSDALKKALEEYDVAQKILYRIRKSHRNEGDYHKLKDITDKLSQQAVLICDKLYQQTEDRKYLEKAFQYAELSKGGLLYEVVQNLQSTADIPREEVLQESGLRTQIVYLKNELRDEEAKGEAADQEKLQSLKKQIAAIKQEHQELLQEFQKKYPKYHQLKFEPSLLELGDLQIALAEDEVFLQYVASDSFIYVMAIDNKKVKTQLKRLDESLHFTVRRLQIAIKKNADKHFESNASKIYQNTLAGLEPFLKNKKLIIAPDAELYYIPFGVLPTKPIGGQTKGEEIYSKMHFFIEDHPICYNHSATAFIHSKSQKLGKGKQLLATWAPVFDNLGEVLLERGYGDHLAPLPGAQKEAKQIADLFGESQAYIAEEATERQFKELANQFYVLHIATHGLLDDAQPLSSSLVLSTESKEDGLLNAYELYDMKLNANLAVLSACNSGMGKLSKEEGVVGVASAFAYAGVPNVIISKWPVSDWSTQVLMTSFYNKLKAGMPKDKALQKAKVDYLKENRTAKPRLVAPFFWASFVVSGNNLPVEPLAEGGSNYLWYIGMGVLLLLLLGFILWRRQKEKTVS